MSVISFLTLQPHMSHVPRYYSVRVGMSCFFYPSTSSTPSQCPCRFVILERRKLCNHFDTDIYIASTTAVRYAYQVHTVNMWRPGCLPGAWRRGSWHYQIARLNLQSIMNLGTLPASHNCFASFPSWASAVAAESSASYDVRKY